MNSYNYFMGLSRNMPALNLSTPEEVALGLAERVRGLRLARAWTQEEIAQRAGITLASFRRFETTGLISLERLLKIALVLDSLPQFDLLFAAPPPTTLAELEKRPTRKRGRRRDAKA